MKSLYSEVTHLQSLAPAGFYAAIRVGFAYPTREYNHLPEGWKAHYVSNGLMTRDPMIGWAYDETGWARCSALVGGDTSGVLDDARRFGLTYGVVASVCAAEDDGLRSFGMFFRSDREFADAEAKQLLRAIEVEHAAANLPELTNAELEALDRIRNGLRLKEAAYALSISESAVKARLNSAKAKLGAKNTTHAAALAIRYGLLAA